MPYELTITIEEQPENANRLMVLYREKTTGKPTPKEHQAREVMRRAVRTWSLDPKNFPGTERIVAIERNLPGPHSGPRESKRLDGEQGA